MDNFVLVGILGVLTLYFYSTASVYKSLHGKIHEEKDMTDNTVAGLEALITKYENQIHNSIATIGDSQDSLQLAREDLQKIKIKNNDLEHRNALLQERVNELYASVGAVY